MLIDDEETRICTSPALLNDWHGVAYTAEVPVGTVTSTRLLGRDLVLWRDESGEVHAWDDRCPHRGASLSRGCVIDSTVQCPYHGWRYGSDGACHLVPSTPSEPVPPRARVEVYAVKERYGVIWASVGTPERDVPSFPEWDDPAFRGFHAGPYRWKANGFRAIENFIDATHFPFVHPDVNGVTDNPDLITDYDVHLSDDGLVLSEIRVVQPYGDPRNTPVLAGYNHTVKRPLVSHFFKRVELVDDRLSPSKDLQSNERFCTLLVVQPVDEVNCVLRVLVAVNFAPELTQADIERRQEIVYAQDQYIVEMQRPRRIPIDLRAEVHHRTDKAGVAYRRWLADLKIDYGTVIP